MPDYRFAEIAYNAHRAYLDEHSGTTPGEVMFEGLSTKSKEAWRAAASTVVCAAAAVLVQCIGEEGEEANQAKAVTA